MEWDRMEWDRMEWDRMEWDSMEWDRIEWGGMGRGGVGRVRKVLGSEEPQARVQTRSDALSSPLRGRHARSHHQPSQPAMGDAMGRMGDDTGWAADPVGWDDRVGGRALSRPARPHTFAFW